MHAGARAGRPAEAHAPLARCARRYYPTSFCAPKNRVRHGRRTSRRRFGLGLFASYRRPSVLILACENFGRTSAPRLPHRVQTKPGSMSDNRTSSGRWSALIVVECEQRLSGCGHAGNSQDQVRNSCPDALKLVVQRGTIPISRTRADDTHANEKKPRTMPGLFCR